MKKDKQQYISQKIATTQDTEEIFSHFYIAENHTDKAIHKKLLPSFQTILAFNFGPEVLFTSPLHTTITLEKCLILGPVKQPVDYTLPPGAELLVANFQPDAFYRFFGQAVTALPVHPDELLNENCFTGLWQLLKAMDTATQRVTFILDFCRPYLQKREITQEKIAGFKKGTPLNPVKTIAGATQQSERTIQLKHQKYLGYSAKEINRYHRFIKAIELLENDILSDRKNGELLENNTPPENKNAELLENNISPGIKNVDWFEIIHQCGYYDQSQLIHDFKHYLGISPTQFLKFQQDICIAKPK